MRGHGQAVMENVRRYRTIASLYRQTAAFRPLQRWSLLDQAEEWEQLAVAELESYFGRREAEATEMPTRAPFGTRWIQAEARLAA